MELRDRDGDLFANIKVVDNFCSVGFSTISLKAAGWTTEGDNVEPTHDLVEYLGKGNRATV